MTDLERAHRNRGDTEMTEYKFTFFSPWFVGYSIWRDELFLYRIDPDDLVYVFRKGIIDAIGFMEFMSTEGWIDLGEL